ELGRGAEGRGDQERESNDNRQEGRRREGRGDLEHGGEVSGSTRVASDPGGQRDRPGKRDAVRDGESYERGRRREGQFRGAGGERAQGQPGEPNETRDHDKGKDGAENGQVQDSDFPEYPRVGGQHEVESYRGAQVHREPQQYTHNE